MTINDHVEEFAGKRVVDWEPEDPVPDPASTIPRISLSWEESEAGQEWTEKFEQFLIDPASRGVTGIVVGPWGEVGTGDKPDSVVNNLVNSGKWLPRLNAIFLGDIVMEESEISWIEQTDVSPLLDAYPALEHFCVRGGTGLSLGALRHGNLKTLIVQTGGLSRQVVRQVLTAELSQLEHLELWLGTEDYGAEATVEDLAPLFAGGLFPQLRYLGLRDSEIADGIAQAVAAAPLLERIEVLDLSLGTLGDEGAAALLSSPATVRLKKLDIHHHYCSPEMVARLTGLGIEVDASDPQEPDEWDGEQHRYVAVGE